MRGMTHILLYPCLFFVAIKAQKCFTIRLDLFNQNVSMKVLCIFLFFVFHRNEPNIFCCIFSFRSALFFMRTVCGFQINPGFLDCTGAHLIILQVFFHDSPQVCLSLWSLPCGYILNMPSTYKGSLSCFIFGTCYEYPHEPQVYSCGTMQVFKFFFNTL